eukprot:TRINITY_DN18842_c1_g3_i1.p1 TRINITY_DN18842_c1_g3~~TRINITY_DN18842_c1_g3_i1.p1  ORF type:complete len:560 (-),score=109.52 TRINITY_DN18842_c1_g3_i1:128-1753(-)
MAPAAGARNAIDFDYGAVFLSNYRDAPLQASGGFVDGKAILLCAALRADKPKLATSEEEVRTLQLLASKEPTAAPAEEAVLLKPQKEGEKEVEATMSRSPRHAEAEEGEDRVEGDAEAAGQRLRPSDETRAVDAAPMAPSPAQAAVKAPTAPAPAAAAAEVADASPADVAAAVSAEQNGKKLTARDAMETSAVETSTSASAASAFGDAAESRRNSDGEASHRSSAAIGAAALAGAVGAIAGASATAVEPLREPPSSQRVHARQQSVPAASALNGTADVRPSEPVAGSKTSSRDPYAIGDQGVAGGAGSAGGSQAGLGGQNQPGSKSGPGSVPASADRQDDEVGALKSTSSRRQTTPAGFVDAVGSSRLSAGQFGSNRISAGQFSSVGHKRTASRQSQSGGTNPDVPDLVASSATWTNRAPGPGEKAFRVQVPRPYPGVQYRASKRLGDRYPHFAKNGTTVVGRLEDGGAWLRLGANIFLPTKVNDMHILEPVSSPQPEEGQMRAPPGANSRGLWWSCCHVTRSSSAEIDLDRSRSGNVPAG